MLRFSQRADSAVCVDVASICCEETEARSPSEGKVDAETVLKASLVITGAVDISCPEEASPMEDQKPSKSRWANDKFCEGIAVEAGIDMLSALNGYASESMVC